MIKELFYKWFGLEEFPCHSCETLQMQLSLKNEENKKLLDTILEMNRPKVEIPVEHKSVIPILPKNIPWSVRQQMIEAEDRKAAQIIQERNRKLAEQVVDEEVEKLEKELEIGG